MLETKLQNNSATPRKFSWLQWMALSLFTVGLMSRVLLVSNTVDAMKQFFYSFAIQLVCYGLAIIILTIHWLNHGDVGSRGALGCFGAMVLSIVAGVALMTTATK